MAKNKRFKIVEIDNIELDDNVNSYYRAQPGFTPSYQIILDTQTGVNYLMLGNTQTNQKTVIPLLDENGKPIVNFWK